MNLKESIIKDSIDYKGGNFSENYFFSKLSEGFVNDYKVFGDDTAEMYSEIFGEEYAPIFESMNESIEVLTEAVESKSTALLFEKDPDETYIGKKDTYGNTLTARANSAADYANRNGGLSDAAKKALMDGKGMRDADLAAKKLPSRGFLGNLWASIKEWGKGLAEKFPGVASFLSKGIGWITGHPAAVLGTAGGAALLAGIVRAMKKRGETKKAAALQTKIDDAAKAGAKGAAATAEKK